MSVLGKLKFLQALVQGFKTHRKIVIIESDDWGSERIPNKVVQKELEKAGIEVNKNPHTKFDSLEREEDLEYLLEVLNKIQTEHNKKVKITTNFITANPDYAKIEKNNFQEYSYEPFTKSYRNRDGDNRVWTKLVSLIDQGYIRPQFHGREHINVGLWLKELQNDNKYFRKAFDLGCYGIDAPSIEGYRKNLMAAFEYDDFKEKEFIVTSIKDGMRLFEEAFGFASASIIAPRYVWNSDLEKEFKALSLRYIQTSFYQQESIKGGYKNIYHYTGQVNKNSGLSYLVRNAYFEPAYEGKTDWVKEALSKVKLAFTFRTPAIISTHRINFVGGVDPRVRERNLNQFRILVSEIIKIYPEVEFLSSDELGDLIEEYVWN